MRDMQRYEKPAMLPLPEGIIAPVRGKNGAGCGFVYARFRRNGKKRRRNDRHPPHSPTVGSNTYMLLFCPENYLKQGIARARRAP